MTQRKIQNYIRLHRPRVASQLSECGGAGTGCGWCVPFLKKCFQAASEDAAVQIEMSPEEYEAEREAYIAAGRKRRQS